MGALPAAWLSTFLALACGGQGSAPPDSGAGPDNDALPGDGGTHLDAHGEYSACSDADRVGLFRAGLEAYHWPGAPSSKVTRVVGDVYDRVAPMDVPVVLKTDGDCALVEPSRSLCTPACAVGQVCEGPGQCAPMRAGQDMGEVTVSGMKDGPLTLYTRRRGHYAVASTLSYPGFDEGDTLTLTATGAQGPALSLVVEGVAPLEIEEPSIVVQPGKPATITWAPPKHVGRSRILIELSIFREGGDARRLVCDTADDGSLDIPEPLITPMFDSHPSGFPSVHITRQTAASFQGPSGCIEFLGYSSVSDHPLEIPGLTSCASASDCPAGQFCNVSSYCE